MRLPAFNAWMVGIGPMSTAHEIEVLLRSRWRELAGEVRRWMPEPWQAAVAWCERVPDLPFVEHLARGGATLPWMRDDPVLREFCDREAAGSSTAPVGGAFAPLAPAWQEPEHLLRCWRDEWNRRRPPRPDDGDEREPLDLLAPCSAGISARSATRCSPTAGRCGAAQGELVLLFRRRCSTPPPPSRFSRSPRSTSSGCAASCCAAPRSRRPLAR
jgi:hypothetical protein